MANNGHAVTQLPAFLRRELAFYPGRGAAIARIAVSCTLVGTVWMVFQIPEPAYAVYIVFLVSGSDTAASVMTGLAGFVAATLAIALSITLYALDAAEPALRVPLMALSTFLGMYLSRTIAAGPVAFLLGFLLVITQTIADVLPNAEALTRFLLWLWLVAAGPAVFTVLVNLWMGSNPAKLLRTSVVALLDTVARSIQEQGAIPVRDIPMSASVLMGLRKRAGLLDRALRARSEIDTDLIETLDAVVQLASIVTPDVPWDARAPLHAVCIGCRDAIAKNARPVVSSPWPSEEVLQTLESTSRPVIIALATLLDRLRTGLTQRIEAAATAPLATPEERSFFVPDAFTNRDHLRFALKATLAAMLSYLIYTGLDWPGIRTCMITCFFVALGSVGETVHKLSLRLSGALIGGLLGGICIVYVIPHLTDIGDLALLMCSAAALCAWVSTSSELLAYAGMQMALAFFLGVLQGYGPATDLTVLRDRVIGIVLGNVVMSIVFSTVWPVSARAMARQRLAGVLRSVADLLRNRAPRPPIGSQIRVTTAIDQARQLLGISIFETPLVLEGSQYMIDRRSIDAAEDIARAALAVVNQPAISEPPFARESQEVATWLADRAAPWVESGGGSANPPVALAEESARESLLAPLALYQRSALAAQADVRRKIARFVAYGA